MGVAVFTGGGVGVAVLVGVWVGAEVAVGVGVDVDVLVGVGVDVDALVGVGVDVDVLVGVRVDVDVLVGIGVDGAMVPFGIKRSQAQPYSGLLPFKGSPLLTNISNTPFDTVTTPNTCSVNWPIVPVFMS